jgi:hypothetical protein
MPEWLISLISVVVGAAIGVGVRELVQWCKRPRLEIDFEERDGQKPYTPDYNDWAMQTAGDIHRIQYLRLMVHNKGKRPAMDCEAKLELSIESGSKEINKVALHWSRRDPALYSKSRYIEESSADPEKIFAPISLNINDKETVDVLSLSYHYSTLANADHSLHLSPYIESASLRQLQLGPNITFLAKVTVYSSNTMPKSFKFNVNWDGTLEGFNKAFTYN